MDELNLTLPRSPSIQARVLEHKFKVEDDNQKNKWQSCCVTADKRAIQYFAQIGIIGALMIFSVSQLIRLDSCDGKEYMSLLMILIGLIIPNPKFHSGGG